MQTKNQFTHLLAAAAMSLISIIGAGQTYSKMAVPDVATTTVNTSILIDVAQNDTLVANGNYTSWGIVGNPVVCDYRYRYGALRSLHGGTLALMPQNKILYTPPAGFSGQDHFIYGIDDSVTPGVYAIDSASVFITVKSPCQASFTHTIVGNSVYFTNTSSADSTTASQFSWNFGDGTNPSGTNNPIHTYSTPGTYGVCLMIIDNSCSPNPTMYFCDTIIISGGQSCNADFTYTLNGNEGTFYNNSGSATLYWVTNPGMASAQYNYTSDLTYINTFSVSGVYKVCLAVKDSNGGFCDSTCKMITIVGEKTTKNLITPNGDGKDDYVYISCSKMDIYNRNGVLVKSLTGPANWDGTDNSGSLLPMGDYVGKCKEDGTVINVSVIR